MGVPARSSWLARAWLVLFLASLAPGFAAEGGYISHTWKTGDGLPQNSVTSIAQTRDGYLWIATLNGLARFDGARFTVYDEGNTSALPESRVVNLAADQDGVLWILGAEGTLTSLAHGVFRVFGPKDGLPTAGAKAVIPRAGGRTLLLGRDGEIRRLREGKWDVAEEWKSLRGSDFDLLVDRNQQLWVWSKTTRILSELVGDRLIPLDPPSGAEAGGFTAVASSRDSGLWVLFSHQIWHFGSRERSWERTGWRVPETAGRLTSLLEDQEGSLWVGTASQGLFCFQVGGRGESIGAGADPSRDAVLALWEDREGSLWVGTDGGGLTRLRPRRVRTFDRSCGFTSDVVSSISCDPFEPDKLWVGLRGGGVNSLQAGVVTPLVLPPFLGGDESVHAVFRDSRGDLWVGTTGAGRLHLEKERTDISTPAQILNSKPLLTALEDRQGRVWLGGQFGLLAWESDRLVEYGAGLGWSNAVVDALAEDASGNLYVGSLGHGLGCLTRGQWTCFSEREGLPDNHILSLCQASDALWIGTLNKGLCLFSRGRFSSLTMQEGLPGNSIASVLTDNEGNLWVGSNRGVFRIPKEQVQEFVSGRRQTVTGNGFGLDDGLSSLECGAACKAADGSLWFATTHGLATLQPDKVQLNLLPPAVVIEELRVEGRKVAAEGGALNSGLRLLIPADHRRLDIRFTGLSFLAPEKVQFRYQLEPFDRNWVDGGTARDVSYTQLPAGTYRFRVKACNNDGVWNEEPAALNFQVLPPWWLTWWARVIIAAITVGSMFWFAEARLNRVKREHAAQRSLSRRLIEAQEEERKRIAGELHDSLGQDLLVIKNRALLGLQGPAVSDKSKEQFTEISRMASTSLAEVREISRDLRPYQLDRLGLTKALQSMITTVAAASGLRCVPQLQPIDGLLAANQEIHCYRIAQELLNNVVKHSQASEARVSAAHESNHLVLVVEDDGCGLEGSLSDGTQVHDQGMGLGDVAERVRILDGKMRCDSQPAKGTRWTIEIPVNNQAKP